MTTDSLLFELICNPFFTFCYQKNPEWVDVMKHFKKPEHISSQRYFHLLTYLLFCTAQSTLQKYETNPHATLPSVYDEQSQNNKGVLK